MKHARVELCETSFRLNTFAQLSPLLLLLLHQDVFHRDGTSAVDNLYTLRENARSLLEQFRTVTVFVLLSRLVLAALPDVVLLSLATLLLFVREFYDLYWIIKVSAARPLDP